MKLTPDSQIPGYEDLSTNQRDIVDCLLDELEEIPSDTLSFLEDKVNEELNKRYDYQEETL
jgi:hypothetical protein